MLCIASLQSLGAWPGEIVMDCRRRHQFSGHGGTHFDTFTGAREAPARTTQIRSSAVRASSILRHLYVRHFPQCRKSILRGCMECYYEPDFFPASFQPTWIAVLIMINSVQSSEIRALFPVLLVTLAKLCTTVVVTRAQATLASLPPSFRVGQAYTVLIL